MRLDPKSGKITWGERLEKASVKRLYESYMAGFGFDSLLDEVGTTLYIRCSDIMYLHDARNGDWRCLSCESRSGEAGSGPRMAPTGRMDPDSPNSRSEYHACPACGWTKSWDGMRDTFRRKQLHSGGAVEAFTGFIKAWEAAAGDVHAKMRAVDQVIHSFHYSLRAIPDLPTRAAGVNLIEGRLSDVLQFLDDLSAGRKDAAADQWRGERNKQSK